jgi:uncharacterized protein YijF (DUF1287 family)
MRSLRKTAAVGTVGLALALCQIASGQAVRPASRAEFTRRLVAAAIGRTHHRVRYVSEYLHIPYPGGDVPADTGVCTDEIIRSYRAVGVDLQKEVHEDMVRNFAAYPNQRRWLLAHPDSNIDHRRVPNLMVFFQRKGETLPITARSQDYAPGDLVTWNPGRDVPHIGIVVDQKSGGSGRYMVVPQHWRGTEDGGRAVQLEDHGTLSIFRPDSLM